MTDVPVGWWLDVQQDYVREYADGLVLSQAADDRITVRLSSPDALELVTMTGEKAFGPEPVVQLKVTGTRAAVARVVGAVVQVVNAGVDVGVGECTHPDGWERMPMCLRCGYVFEEDELA